MKIFGFDISFAYECITDLFNLMSAYKEMTDKKVNRLKEKVAETAETVESVEVEGNE